jgi:hypothetical protein
LQAARGRDGIRARANGCIVGRKTVQCSTKRRSEVRKDIQAD